MIPKITTTPELDKLLFFLGIELYSYPGLVITAPLRLIIGLLLTCLVCVCLVCVCRVWVCRVCTCPSMIDRSLKGLSMTELCGWLPKDRFLLLFVTSHKLYVRNAVSNPIIKKVTDSMNFILLRFIQHLLYQIIVISEK